MVHDDRQKWNSIYQTGEHDTNQAAEVLTTNLHLLPTQGTALDLACGLGANAMLLAEAGLHTHAWDISDIAITKLYNRAIDAGFEIQVEQRDVIQCPPTTESFDVIIVSRFLARSMFNFIIEALTKNGLLFYQTFTCNKLDRTGPENPDYLLGRNELLTLFNTMNIIYYRENDTVGKLDIGNRNEAMIIAQKI